MWLWRETFHGIEGLVYLRAILDYTVEMKVSNASGEVKLLCLMPCIACVQGWMWSDSCDLCGMCYWTDTSVYCYENYINTKCCSAVICIVHSLQNWNCLIREENRIEYVNIIYCCMGSRKIGTHAI
jgi:hypothetical protein